MRLVRPALVATLAAALCAAAPALAQDANANIAKPACTKPQFPGRLASEAQKKSFNKDVETYAQCIKKYVSDQQKLADDHIKAANAAAADYNNAVKELQSEIDKAKE
ncbi:MAG TPA: hypothetical protein VFC24_16735 [Casimicrobiaceae bacterium]|nr:hypothetical protein [Casimicrobiaceae bacterium]